MTRDRRRAVAFAPGRVNLIGEHTDYNAGLCLPVALEQGVTVTARALAGEQTVVHSRELAQDDSFPTARPTGARGWRAFARGVVSELQRSGCPVPSARLDIASDLALGAGLASSAALAVALALALRALAGAPERDRMELARSCSRVEHEWVGTRGGLLDQIAALFGEPDAAIKIDCRSYELEAVPLRLHGWRFALFSSGAERELASTGYNQRRAECRRAAELLGLPSLREATLGQAQRLPEPLRRRVRHVVSENGRVLEAVRALRRGDAEQLGALLDASHASLRDDYEASVPAVEATVERARAMGAGGARLMGGGFGGSVLALLAPGIPLPEDASAVRTGPGASLRPCT